MKRNPFSFGNPVNDPDRFYGRKREIRQITDRLLSSAFESTSVVGERRIGKTSLLKYLATPQVAEEIGLDPDYYVIVYVDFQGCVKITPARFWSRILRRVARKLADDELATMAKELGQQEEIDQFDLEDLFFEIEDLNQKLILLMDEFEYVTRNENFDLDFFAGLRALAIHFPLSLITATRKPLVDLCHSTAIQGSPFFNIFASLILKPFQPDETLLMIDELLTGSGVEFSEADKKRIKEYADGHPIYIQMMGYYYYEGYQMGLSGKDLHNHAQENFLLQAKPHFEYQWNHSDEREKITLLTLLTQLNGNEVLPTEEQLEEIYSQSSYVLPGLVKRGLVLEKQGDYYDFFSPLFKEWLKIEVSAGREERQSSDSVEEWLENQAEFDRTMGEKIGSTFPKIKQKYWPLLVDFAMNASAEVAGSFLVRLGGL